MFGYTYDSSLAETFKVTVIATGINPTSYRPPRQPLEEPENGGGVSLFDKPSVVAEPEDEMLIPACMRRSKTR